MGVGELVCRFVSTKDITEKKLCVPALVFIIVPDPFNISVATDYSVVMSPSDDRLNIATLKTLRDAFSSDEETVEAFDEAIQLAEAVLESNGYRIQILHSDLHRSHYIVNKNYEELIAAIEAFEGDHELEVSESNREGLEPVLLEFGRHLQNYVAAVRARVDHLYDTVIQELESIEGDESGLRESYEEKMAELDLSHYGSFFTGLRNHFMHDRPPIPVGNEIVNETWDAESGNHSREVDRNLKLRKQDLEEGDYLNSEARNFLESLSDEFHVRPLVEDFQERMEEVFDWLDDEIESRFEEELNHTTQLHDDAVDQQKELLTDLGLLDNED